MILRFSKHLKSLQNIENCYYAQFSEFKFHRNFALHKDVKENFSNLKN